MIDYRNYHRYCWVCLCLLVGDAFAAPVRIVSLGAGVTETVFALGLGDSVVGVDVSSQFPPAALKKPKVGYVRQTSAEGIASLRPDLVLAPTTIGPPAVIEQLKAVGVSLELLQSAKRVNDAIVRIKRIGTILGKENEAENLVDRVQKSLAQAKAHVAGRSAKRILFVFIHGGTNLQVAGTETAAHAMLQAAGAINAVTEFSGYKSLAAEALLKARPDIILATTRSLRAVGGADGLWASPGMLLTPAGQAKRLIVLDDLELLSFGPRTGDSVLKLTRAIYP